MSSKKTPQPSRKLVAVVLAALVLTALFSVWIVSPSSRPQTATVQFLSARLGQHNGQGYACFLNYPDPVTGAPLCMSDDPSLMLPANATVPLGNYTIVFFPLDIASNQSEWYSTYPIEVTGSGAYDASSSYANVTIRGNGVLAVMVLPENGVAIPEFSGVAIVSFSALAASLFLLRRRRN